MKRINTFALTLMASSVILANASQRVYFPMTVEGTEVVEAVSGNRFAIDGARTPVSVPGAKGTALRLDGYTSFISADIADAFTSETKNLTISVWCAPETYPIMAHDQESGERCVIVGNLDETAKTGFAFLIGRNGKYQFKCYAGGWAVNCEAAEKMPCYEWNNLVAVIDGDNRRITLYNNGVEVASSRSMGTVSMGTAPLTIGRATEPIMNGIFQINNFNGIIDEIEIFDTALTASEIASWSPENEAQLAFPKSRYANDIMRPRFHGMPSANWSNECHGLVKYDGKYHLFFQKNANGPYMSRLQWGHIVSTDLANWTEMPIAITADQSYDIKGCWSGCVFTDDQLTGGKPNIFYTAVDYARAIIAQASPADNELLKWNKSDRNPIVDGRPAGLSDDFRDPYVFTNNGEYYMIVGTSKNNLGAVTLHRYDKDSQTWSNDGSTFFTAPDARSGRFWEMPTINKIGDKWIFTCTPLPVDENQTPDGTEIQYWVGSIAADGTFVPDSREPRKVELDGMSHDGIGMLSPAITEADGKTIAMGIVPDRLPGERNIELGWAHTYNLPREWTLDSEGNLVQRPFSGLTTLRSATSYELSDMNLSGSVALGDVSGRMVEVCGEFVLDSSTSEVGFELLKSGSQSLKLYYSKALNKMVVDITSLDRWVNDEGFFNGLYESELPKRINDGETVKIHAFFDHSILDVFVNDTWAFSVRVWATNEDANGVEAFATGNAGVKSIQAWKLEPEASGSKVENITADEPSTVVYATDSVLHIDGITGKSRIAIYDLASRKVSDFVIYNDAAIPVDYNGEYIVNVVSRNRNDAHKVIIK